MAFRSIQTSVSHSGTVLREPFFGKSLWNRSSEPFFAAITAEQFFALEDFAKQLEQYFEAHSDPQKRLYYERRERQYDSQAIEKTRVVTQRELMKAFASMYLNEPHSATKSYGSLKQKVGKDMFIKGHRMEPYYAAALASYHVDFMFRNGRIDPKYKTARYHIIMAIRLREAGYKMPHMSANQMEKYCKKLIDRLANDPEGVIAGAVSSITEVSGGNMDRENIRTEAFTKDVISSLPSSA